MTFLISSTKEITGTPGPFFGIFNETNKFNSSNLLAVEMDTSKTIGFKDIDNNHIGIDVNSIRSVNSSSAAYIDDNKEYKSMNLPSGDSMQVWIDCSGTNIEVRISPIGASRPKIALVSSQLNLSSVLLDEMYVGFSASTGDVTAFHYVQEWSFSLNDDAEALDVEHIQPIPHQFNTEKHLQPITVALPFVGVIILLVLLFVAYFVIKRKRKFSELLEDWEIEYGPHRFTYKDLFKATKGFQEDNLLGVGGFGRVYKGVLPKSNLEIAVKKISHESQQGMKEFVAEIVSMGRLRHRNLVQLLGYCRRQRELLLVYEFMPNSSLDKFLFGDKKATLNWKQRFQVIQGVASGLLYLHDGWEQVVIHRDIKAANVLLDYELNGKLGDFGLARLYDHGSNPQTTHIVGTLGYLAPELSRTGKATTQTDAYAFGAFLLEVACGKRPMDMRGMNLVDLVMGCWKRGDIMEARDLSLGKEYDEKEMELVLRLGLFCSHPDPSARPSMRQVVQFLGGDAVLDSMSFDFDSAPSRAYDQSFDDFIASMEYASSSCNTTFAANSSSQFSTK